MPDSQLRAARQADSALLFGSLGDETRLALVSRLSSGGPQSISRLTSGTDMTRQGITKHLRVMQHAGLVHSKREGRKTVWQLDRNRLDEARQYLEFISRKWDEALLRLQTFVEGND